MLKKQKQPTEQVCERPLSNEQPLLEDFIEGLAEKDSRAQKQYKKTYRRMRPRCPRFLVPVLLFVTALALAASLLYHFGLLQSFGRQLSALFTPNKVVVNSEPPKELDSPADNNSTQENTPNGGNTAAAGEATKPNSTAPTKIFAAALNAGVEYQTQSFETDVNQIINEAVNKGLTTVFVSLNTEAGLLTETAEGTAAFSAAVAHADEKNIAVFATVDISKLSADDFTNAAALQQTSASLTALAKTPGLDGLMLSGLSRNKAGKDFRDYIKTGTLTGYKNYSEAMVTNAMQSLSHAIRTANPALYLGLICDSVYATADVSENGMAVQSDNQLLRDQNADVLKWAENGLLDVVFVRANTTTNSKSLPFETVVKWWSERLTGCNVGYILSGDLAQKQQNDWKNPDQLVRQLKCLNEINRYVFCFNSYRAITDENSEAISAALDFISGDNGGTDYILNNLSFTAPAKRDFTTYENRLTISGASDPKFKLTLNGQEVKRTEYGYFSLEQPLKVGKNTFTFSHKGSTETFTVTYRYVVLKEVSPTSAIKLDGGSTLMVKALARTGSTVSATLNGTTVKLSAGVTENQGSEFCTYTGNFILPDGYSKDTAIGKITFKGSHNGVTETATGGRVTVKKTELPSSGILINDPGATPTGGSYINVGSGYVAEVVKYQVETFDGKTVDDYSQPYNNYLPKGTLDYCSTKTVYDPESGGNYRLLRCGRRVYTANRNGTNVKTYAKTLPAGNKITVKSCNISGHHTVLTLAVDWKAPFLLDILPQTYNPKDINNRGKVSAVTFNYIDITLCYATAFNGEINLADNPLFSRAQVIKNTADYTLRLYLKKTGAFYGWTADYNSAGNLVFKFLNPVHAKAASNPYGGTLNGIKIVVDAGHGGSDGGASGSNKNYNEAVLSLDLAKRVETKLKSIGATVIMTRTDNSTLSQDTRILKIRDAMPDLAVSVHRNAATRASANGYYSYYFNAYTANPAEKITRRMKNSGVYNSYNTGWHYFYLSRISNCPVVLTENGFMSNSTDYQNMMNSARQEKCADAIVQGIVDHFLSQ